MYYVQKDGSLSSYNIIKRSNFSVLFNQISLSTLYIFKNLILLFYNVLYRCSKILLQLYYRNITKRFFYLKNPV